MTILENKVDFFNIHFWKENDFDYLLVTDDLTRKWLSNFSSSSGFILLSRHWKKPKFFLDPRYFTQAKSQIIDFDVEPLETFFIVWKKLTGKVGFENSFKHFLFQQLTKINPNVRFHIFDFSHLRLIKSPEEIAYLRYICHLTSKIWEKILVFIQKPKTEKEVERFIITQFLQYEVHELSFFPIVSSDQRSAFIHTQATNHKIKNVLLCDFGGKWNGFCSDFSRTLVLDSQSKLHFYFKIIQKIHKKIIDHIKPGIPIKELALIANEIYQKHNLKLEHALGHGIGLEVHENPILSEFNELILKPGMVFTVEPGVYLPHLGGIRIEDVVLVTETGCEILTQ